MRRRLQIGRLFEPDRVKLVPCPQKKILLKQLDDFARSGTEVTEESRRGSFEVSRGWSSFP
ncbi:MAG: hypothetical protein DWI25_00310 [Planctomycetota bacterium]|nr:MAG: hypothetical protein DWI25_00310 [Planctomycetota bacterium]